MSEKFHSLKGYAKYLLESPKIFFWKDLLLKGLPINLASKMLCKWVNYGIYQAITQKFNKKAQKVL